MIFRLLRMTARYSIAALAQWLEDLERKEGSTTWRGKALNLMLNQSMADKCLPATVKTLSYNPLAIISGIVVLYVVFCVIYLPLYLFSLIFTGWGSIVLLIGIIVISARSFARTIMFPGSTKNLQKQYASDFLRRLTFQIEHFAVMAANFGSSLLLLATPGRMGRPGADLVSRKFREVQLMSEESLPELVIWVRNTSVELQCNNGATSEEIELLTTLQRASEDLIACVAEVKPCATDLLALDGSVSVYGQGNIKSGALHSVCRRLMQSAEALKVAAVAVKPRDSSSEGDEMGGAAGGVGGGGLLGTVRAFLNGSDGPSGAEKFAFPLMREQLRSLFGGERLSIAGSDDNNIDGMYIPSAQRFEESARASAISDLRSGSRDDFQRGSSTTTTIGAVSSVGTVLFCSPNAGLYECVSQANKDASWVGFYTRLGFDICYFNYRGYSTSTGVPCPSRVKSDGLIVAKYLRQVKRVTKLLVHGESIGGLVACHIAASCPVDLLVCDRTFASLDATAARLMGQWASLGLRYVANYRTDVVRDYLKSTCPKAIIQDPNDEIIHNSASLKNGVATSIMLGDRLWDNRSLPHEYVLADVTGRPVPQTLASGLSAAALTQQSRSLETPVSEEFICHFCACLLNISRRAAQAVVRRRRGGGGAGSGAGGGGSSSSSASSSSASSAGSSSGGGLGGVGSPTRVSLAPKRTVEKTSSRDPDDLEGQDDVDLDDIIEDVIPSHVYLSRDPATGAVPSPEWLEAWCAQDVLHDRGSQSVSLSPLERVWICLSRLDGCSGQLLGQALGSEVDGLRCWVCSLLLWSSRSASDPSMPRGCVKLRRVQDELGTLCEAYAQALGKDASVSFVREALEVLALRCEQIARTRQAPLASSPSSSTSSGTALLAYVSMLSQYGSTNSSTPTNQQHNVGDGDSINQAPSTSAAAQTPSVPQQHVRVDKLGRVIPVHCGHNGWPALGLPALIECIREAGFEPEHVVEFEGASRSSNNFPSPPRDSV